MSEKIRLFKIEYESQDPIIVTGDRLLELAKKEENDEFPFEGTTIDDAFKYFYIWESIQECDVLEELQALQKESEELKKKCESYQCSQNCYQHQRAEKLEQENTQLKTRLKELETKCDSYESALEEITELSEQYDLFDIQRNILNEVIKQALEQKDQ